MAYQAALNLCGTFAFCMGRSPSFKVVRGAADALAKEWCYQQPNVTLISVPVNWGDLSHPDALICTRADGSKYDANAGIRSCAGMLDEEPDFVLAFPGNNGARDMLRAEDAKKKGMPIVNQKGRLVELHYLAAIPSHFRLEPSG
jgi:hypothetical protein